MADVSNIPEDGKKRSLKLPLIIGLLLACIGGGTGFYVTSTGLLFSGDSSRELSRASAEDEGTQSDVTYIEMDPLTISLRRPSKSQYLRFRGSLEVTPSEAKAVEELLPRVTDVLNSYLRSLDPSDLDDASALARLRGHMLRRIQVVVGKGRVNDLLIIEFVLN